MPSPGEAVGFADLTPERRDRVRALLEESFVGRYRFHALRTLDRVERVRTALHEGEVAGASLLQTWDRTIGYVYYVAVRPDHRRQGIGGLLLDDAIAVLRVAGVRELYAAFEEENGASQALFGSRGFRATDPGELSRRYGRWRAQSLRYRMMLVPGEILVQKTLVQSEIPEDPRQAPD
jgi:ribosomal protein S18 acetylase RimI-like enzyme